MTSGIISASDHSQLKEKSKKSVKFILRKVKSLDDGDALLKDCLTKSSGSQGHQRLLSILYTKDSSSGS